MNALELAPRTHLILALIISASTSLAAEPQSTWVQVSSPGGKLAYQSLSTGDHIMDFSHAGYMGGGVALPMVPVKMKVRPTGADDTATIQAAINAVAALTPENGIRGAVLLDGARFNCASTLTISASGIVLRGNGAAKTIIAMRGTPHVCLSIEGSRSVRGEGRSTKIADAYVPSGAASLKVESAEGLNVGDTLLITRPVTPEWVAFMGMDKLVRDGKPQTWISRSIVTERVIKDISGSTITLTVPLSDSLDARRQSSAEVKVSKATITGGIDQVGVEGLGISSKPQPIEITDDHNSGIELSGVTDGWVRDVAIENAITSIKIESSTRRVTIEKVELNHQKPTLGNAKPLDINIEGSQVFINRCSGKGDDIFYVATGGGVIGPNVVMNCEFKGNGEIQPHMRWATGLLVDNSRVPKGGIDFMNRGNYGTGHGWTIGWAVGWNCSASRYTIQQPPGATNWAIGCCGERKAEPMPGSESKAKDAVPISGIFDSHNRPVTPRSLYLAQLAERLGVLARLSQLAALFGYFRDFLALEPLILRDWGLQNLSWTDLGGCEVIFLPNFLSRNIMRLKCHTRIKDGKEHRYWSIVESVRCSRERVVQRHVLYLGELNDSQHAGWTRCLEAVDGGGRTRQLALFPADRELPVHAGGFGVQVRLEGLRLERPRQWGACWLFTELWAQLRLDEFWRPRLPESREGTSWYHLLMVSCAYRLIDPGSEWRLHRLWFEQSAMADLLEEDFALAAKDNLYRVLDKLLVHKAALIGHLQERWKDMFGASFDVLLYDLTSTYFECEPKGEDGLRRFGHSRDKRSDCVQVVIALIVTPEGFPLAYEVLPGNTVDKSTLKGFLEKIQTRYGRARRVWVMDRGIPTEEVLGQMREASEPPVQYLVGTPKGRLGKLEAELLKLPWQQAREGVRVKLLPQDQELYVCVESQARVGKERSMRRRRLRKLIARLKELQAQQPSYETLLLKLGAAKSEAGRDWSLVDITLPEPPTKKAQRRERTSFTFKLNKERLRTARRREGRYLLRSNLTDTDPEKLWHMYLQLTQVEQAFKDLKGDLSVRPVHHQKDSRIEAHILVSFLAYCIHVTLREKLRRQAPGLTPRQALDHLGKIQMIDVHLPTTDKRELLLRRRTEPNKEQQMLLSKLKLTLPQQRPPKISGV